MAATSNFGSALPSTLSLYVQDKVSWKICGIVGLAYAIIYIIILRKDIMNLSLKNKSE